MNKVGFKRAKLTGELDVLAFLFCLVLTAGYAVIEIAKLTGLPTWLTNAWTTLSGGVEKAFGGVFLDWLKGLPQYPGVPFVVIFGVLALLFLIMAVCSFKQGGSILKKGCCAFAGILSLLLLAACGLLFAEHFLGSGDGAIKWYLLAPCAFLFLQTILKFSAYARAY